MRRSRTGESIAAASLAVPVIVLLALVAALGLCRREPGPPVADHAVFELVLRDAGAHLPLLGPYSRFGWFHPGPLIYYLLLPFYSVLGGAFALNIGAGVLNTLSVAGIVILAFRRLSPPVWWALATGLLVTFRYLTPPVLMDPWNPYLLVLPFTLWVFVAAEAAGGATWAWPALVALGSFLVQSHVGTAFALLPLALVTAGLAMMNRKWDDRRTSRRPSVRNVVLTSLGIALLVWAGPIYEAAAHQGGNLARLWDFATSAAPPEADGTSTRTWAGAAQWAGLPLYLSQSLAEVSPNTQHQPVRMPGRLAVSLAAALLLAGVALAGLRAVRGKAARPLARAVLAAAMLPVGAIYGAKLRGEPLAYLYVWLWGTTPLLAVTIAEGILVRRSEAVPSGRSGSRAPVAIMGLLVAIACALPLLPAAAHPFERGTWASHDPRRAQVAALRDGALRRLSREKCTPLLTMDEPDLWVQDVGLLLALAKAGKPVATEPYPGMPPGQPHRPYGDCDWDLHLRRLPVRGSNDDAEFVANAGELQLVTLPRAPIVWGVGWTPKGDWGRWMSEREALLYLRATGPGQRRLVFEVAPSETMSEPQTLDVISADGDVLAHHVIRGKPWEWQPVSCPLPDVGMGALTLRLRAARTYPEFRSWRRLSLPVRGLELK
jgi:hypothetical protein